VKVKWDELRLTKATGEGYADAATSVGTAVADVIKGRKELAPLVVWVFDAEDLKANRALETKVFCDEKVGLALQRLVCLKVDVRTLPGGKMADDLKSRTPLFLFYNPAGKVYSELEGVKATARTGFYGQVTKLWGASFDLKLTDYSRKMTAILRRIDKNEKARTTLEAKKALAGGNAAKMKAVTRGMAKVDAEEQKILVDEQNLIGSCKVKPEFTKPE
jgi:hypothetical protein